MRRPSGGGTLGSSPSSPQLSVSSGRRRLACAGVVCAASLKGEARPTDKPAKKGGKSEGGGKASESSKGGSGKGGGDRKPKRQKQ